MKPFALLALSLFMAVTALAQTKTSVELSSLPRPEAASAAAIGERVREFDLGASPHAKQAGLTMGVATGRKKTPRVAMAPLAITITQGLGGNEPLRFSITTTRDIPAEALMLLRAVNADGSIAGAATYFIGGFPADATFYNVHAKEADSLTFSGAYRLEAFTLDLYGFGYVYAERLLNANALDQSAPFIRGAEEGYSLQVTGKFNERGETHVVVGFMTARSAHVSESVITVGFEGLPYYLNPGLQPVTVCQNTRCDSHVVRHVGLPGPPAKGVTGTASEGTKAAAAPEYRPTGVIIMRSAEEEEPAEKTERRLRKQQQ